VIIPARNRPDDLKATVGTLLAQTILPQELIVIDQSPRDASERRIRELFSRENNGECVTLQYIRDPRISGAATARNEGLQRSFGDIILFLDDDVVLDACFIENLLRSYKRDADVAGVSGIVVNYARPAFLGRLWTWIFARGPFFDDRQPVYFNADQLRSSPPIRVTRFGGGLMSFRAAAIQGARFDENLTGASEGEDVDFCMRLPAGTKLVIDPSARLVHKVSPAARAPEHWIGPVVRGNTYLYYRNWNTGLKNRACFFWFKAGYALLSLAASGRQRSLAPWRAFRDALEQGRVLGTAAHYNSETEEASRGP
jgi:GT2 family glycosyltransferase